MTTKNIVRIIVLTPTISFIVFCMAIFIQEPLSPKYKDCGRIVSKSNDEVAIKHGVKTELYLNIQFEKAGFKSIEIDPTTYFKYNTGETICTNLKQERNDWINLFCILGLIFLIILIVILLGLLIDYLFI